MWAGHERSIDELSNGSEAVMGLGAALRMPGTTPQGGTHACEAEIRFGTLGVSRCRHSECR